MNIGLIFLGIVLIIIGVGVGCYGWYCSYQYESKIGSYFDNARDSITPELLLQQIEAGKSAMMSEGLTPEMYGAIWFTKPDNKMSWQYAHIDSIIERAKAVVDWKQKSYSQEGQAETMKDVYNEKMDNLRNYVSGETSDKIAGSRSDWIGKNTWWIKHHIILYLFDWVLLLGLCGLGILLFWVGCRLD